MFRSVSVALKYLCEQNVEGLEKSFETCTGIRVESVVVGDTAKGKVQIEI
jgi:hypothetical protein